MARMADRGTPGGKPPRGGQKARKRRLRADSEFT